MPKDQAMMDEVLAMMGELPANKAANRVDKAAFDMNRFAKTREQAFNEDQTGSEVYFDEQTLDLLRRRIGEEGMGQLSADQVNMALQRDASDEATAWFNSLPPNIRMEVMQAIAGSDGLGGMDTEMNYRNKTK